MVENDTAGYIDTKIWIITDERGFVEGWSYSKLEGGIEVPFNKDIVDRWSLYRYTNESFIYDESKVLSTEKATLASKARDILSRKTSTSGLEITLNNEKYVYPYNANNKSYLNKIYDIMDRGLIDDALFNFIKEGVEESVKLNKTNIYELWMLSYFYEEESEIFYSNTMNEINSVGSISELEKVGQKIDSIVGQL